MEYGIKIKCLRNPKEIHETLYRIGIPRLRDKVLWPSCHLIEDNNEFYICHFKECFLYEGSYAELSEDDYKRRNKIAKLLDEHFNMIDIIDRQKYEDVIDHVFILKHSNKWEWDIRPKYIPILKNEKDGK